MFGRRYGAAVRVTGSATLHCGRVGMRAGGDMPDRPDKLNRQLSAGNPADTIAVDRQFCGDTVFAAPLTVCGMHWQRDIALRQGWHARGGIYMPDRPDKLNRQLSAGNPADTIAVDLRLFYAIAVNTSLFS